MIKTKVWAHRGASGYAPENTLEAFALAVKMGADGVELDVQLTKDGQLVVTHDENIQRVSTGNGFVKDYTLVELKKFHFNKTHSKFHNVEIPTLDEVLQFLKPTDLEINIELKTSVFPYPGIEEKVLQLVEKMGLQERVWYSSFEHRSVKKIQDLAAKAHTGLLYGSKLSEALSYGKSFGAEALHPAFPLIESLDFIEQCKAIGLKIHTWTVNDEEQMKRCCFWGVDSFITNFPDRAKQCLEQIKTAMEPLYS